MKELAITWLGQSGFLLRHGDQYIACDLYLSDYCKKKSRLDHTRKMEIPLRPESLDNISHYLITHGHIDHFDPETVGPVMRAGERVHFYCPPVCQSVIKEYFPADASRFTLLNSMREYELAPGLRLFPIPAAHEELEKDADGEYIAFSYLLLFDAEKTAVFFGGDTMPYPGHAQNIRACLPDDYKLTVILPVNGRDAERAALGFKGNLTIDEAIKLYHQTDAQLLIPCHFGMFALNDLKEPLAMKLFDDADCRAIIPKVQQEILL